jgi:ferredoxin-NADP reductase
VIELRRILPDVTTVRFESLDRPYQYHPGQFAHLALDPYDATRPWPDSRCFSIQSPPSANQRTLAISFATKGAFTRRMSEELALGREVWLKMPYGDLLASDCSERACVFLAGGTGVTPFLSLFLDEGFSRFAGAFLYLGVRHASYHVFASELAQAQRVNPRFVFEVFPENERGQIPLDRLLQRHGQGAVYFISGPSPMIRTFRERLLAAGVPNEHVRSDDWE